MKNNLKLITDEKEINKILNTIPAKPFILSDVFEARISNQNIVKVFDYFDDSNYLVNVVAILPYDDKLTNPESLFTGEYEWFGNNKDYFFWLY